MHFRIIFPPNIFVDLSDSIRNWASLYGHTVHLETGGIGKGEKRRWKSIFLRILLFVESRVYSSVRDYYNLNGFNYVKMTNSPKDSETILLDFSEVLSPISLESWFFNQHYFKNPTLDLFSSENELLFSISKKSTISYTYGALVGRFVLLGLQMRQVPSFNKSVSFRSKRIGFSGLFYATKRFLETRFDPKRNNWSIAYRVSSNGEWTIQKKEFLGIEADPFLVKENGKIYMFYEHMLFGSKGEIYYRVWDDEKFIKPTKVLAEKFHLSFPNIFKIEGEWYMIPETASARCLRIYKAVNFPEQWNIYKIGLLGWELLDPVIDFKNQILYGTIHFPGLNSPNDDLYQIPIKSLLDLDFDFIPEMPVESNVRKARNGGPLLHINGKNYRPSQDCGPYYGYSLKLLPIDPNLQHDSSSEVLKNFGSNNFRGVHTYGKIGSLEVIDLMH